MAEALGFEPPLLTEHSATRKHCCSYGVGYGKPSKTTDENY